MIIIMIFMPLLYNNQMEVKNNQLFNEYNDKISTAARDASKELLNNYDSRSIELSADGNKENFQAVNLNLDKALSTFYKSLFLNFGIENDYLEQEKIKNKIPLKLAVGYDGYYICSWEEVKINGINRLQEKWSDKINYSLLDSKSNIKIDFTLDDYVYITNLSDGSQLEGRQSSFISKYPNSIFGDKFEGLKTQIIMNLIQEDLKLYTSLNNKYSKEYGFEYTFTIPYIGNTSISNVSFIAFLQGVPLKGMDKVYNNFSLGISNVAKSGKIYGYVYNGKKFYSKEKPSNYTSLTLFDSEKEAAAYGYYPLNN